MTGSGNTSDRDDITNRSRRSDKIPINGQQIHVHMPLFLGRHWACIIHICHMLVACCFRDLVLEHPRKFQMFLPLLGTG